ncbi:MAG: putative DNA binding domain-containing protein [Sphingomonadales bacterium]|nr:putative DNA binding domain-containing protein [Sphingomonadales bacterium]
MPLAGLEIEDLLLLSMGESEVLEFKSELPAVNDRGKAEFLKDVCAMANASGGIILYGIDEVDGCASSLTTESIPDSDQVIRRLAQISQDNIEPALRVSFSVIDVSGYQVLAAEVPQSFSGPHRFKFNEKQRFVRRYDRHIADLTYDQLRAAFGGAESRLARIESWWKVVDASAYFARQLRPGPSMVSALVPTAYDGRTSFLDPKRVEQNWSDLMMTSFGGGSRSFNYHGLSVFPGARNEPVRAFTQAERFGPVLTWWSVEDLRQGRDEKWFHGAWYVRFLSESLRTQRRVFERHGIGGSFFFFSKFQGLQGWKMIEDGGIFAGDPSDGTADCVEIGPIFIDDVHDISTSGTEVFTDHVDRLWQAYGQASCPQRYFEALE